MTDDYVLWLRTDPTRTKKLNKLLLFLEEVSFAGYSSWPWTQLPMGIPSTVWPKYTNFGRSPPANRLNRGFLGRGGRNLHDGKFSSGPIVFTCWMIQEVVLTWDLNPCKLWFLCFWPGVNWLMLSKDTLTCRRRSRRYTKMMDWGHWWRW